MSDEYRTRQERKKAKQQTPKQSKKNKGTGSGKSRGKKILTALTVIFLVMMAAGGITAIAIIAGAPSLDEEKLIMSNNPEIYDIDGELVTTLSGSENRRLVDIEDVPDVMKDAIIAVEDIRFYDHFGLDVRRIGGAVIANVTGGFGAEGASTITQQVVKNLFFDFDKKITRKIQEQYLAVRLEQKFTKDQILEMYLNVILMSGNRYGIVEGAEFYFNKDLDELTIADAALLAGIPQRPNAYNPFNNPELAEQRRNVVLSQMEKYGKITAEEAEEARNIPVEDQLEESDKEAYPYQAYLDRVLTEVESIDGVEASDIYTSGMKIYTNLDQNAQEHVEEVMQTNNYINFPDDQVQAGITLMDSSTGQVTAIGGKRQPAEGVRSWNWATQPRRQPGSAIKPILDYGPAIEHFKWSTYHQIRDEEYKYNTIDQVIRNANRQYHGDVSMRYALQQSLNVPAVKAFHEVGQERSKAFGESLGLPLDSMGETYSLGGFSNGLSSFQMAGAYGAFANGGEFNRPHTVQRIEYTDGRTINLAPDSEKVMEDYTAFMISDMLKTVVQQGTGQQAAISGLPVAGKTGSSNFTSEDRQEYSIPEGVGAVRDSWFAGYTTEYTAAVWAGYNSPSDGVIRNDNGSNLIARHLFREVMSHAHEGVETSDFQQPDSVVRVGVEKGTGLLPSDFTPESEITYEYFVKGTEPSSVSDEYEIEADDLPAPDVTAEYNEDEHAIYTSWSFDDDLVDEFSFQLEIQGPEGDFETITITKDREYMLNNPEYGETYTIRVTAISDQDEDLASDPGTVDITVPEEDDLVDEDIPDEIFEEDEAELDEGDEGNEGPGQGNGPPDHANPPDHAGPPDDEDEEDQQENGEEDNGDDEDDEDTDGDSGDEDEIDDTEQEPEQ